MARKPKAEADKFPGLTCAACRFCLGSRDEWECWAGLPLRDPPPGENTRGANVAPSWPACYFFNARENG